MKNLDNFGKKIKKIQDLFNKSSFFKHCYDLTGPKYSIFYEDSESGIKSIHFLAKMIKKHDFMSKCWTFFGNCLGQPFLGHWWGAKKGWPPSVCVPFVCCGLFILRRS